MTFSISILLLIYVTRFLFIYGIKRSISKIAITWAKGFDSSHIAVIIFFLLGFIGAGLALRGFGCNHGIFSGAAVPSALIILVYIANFLYHNRWRLLVYKGIVFEFVLFVWLHMYFVISRIGWTTDSNWALKSRYNLIFIKDYIGNSWVIFVLLAILIEILMVMIFLKYYSITKNRF